MHVLYIYKIFFQLYIAQGRKSRPTFWLKIFFKEDFRSEREDTKREDKKTFDSDCGNGE